MMYATLPVRRPTRAPIGGAFFVNLGFETDEELWRGNPGEMFVKSFEGQGKTLSLARAAAEKAAESYFGADECRRRFRNDACGARYEAGNERWVWLAGQRYPGGPNDRPKWFKDTD